MSGGVTPSGGVLTWNLGSQRPGSDGSAWFTVTANSGPLATTSATISDAIGESRTATETTTIEAPLAVGLADVNAGQAEATTLPLVAVIATALLA